MSYKIARGFVRVFIRLFYRLKIIGKENISNEGKLIICANHIHVFDPLFVAVCTRRIICFMAKKELFQGLFGFLIKSFRAIPVNRDGNDSYSLKRALQALKGGNILGIFPEGTRSEGDRLEFKPGVSMLSIKTKTKIVPIYIEGNYKIFSKMTAVVGKAYELTEYYGKKLTSDDYEEIANNEIAESISKLKMQIS